MSDAHYGIVLIAALDPSSLDIATTSAVLNHRMIGDVNRKKCITCD